jgi:hypothetical protein
MKYTEFRDSIKKELQSHPEGLTWIQLKTSLKLPYDRPCQTWLYRMEKEIGLVRRKGNSRAYKWTL